MIVTLFSASCVSGFTALFATYSRLPSGLIAMPLGAAPVLSVGHGLSGYGSITRVWTTGLFLGSSTNAGLVSITEPSSTSIKQPISKPMSVTYARPAGIGHKSHRIGIG